MPKLLPIADSKEINYNHANSTIEFFKNNEDPRSIRKIDFVFDGNLESSLDVVQNATMILDNKKYIEVEKLQYFALLTSYFPTAEFIMAETQITLDIDNLDKDTYVHVIMHVTRNVIKK